MNKKEMRAQIRAKKRAMTENQIVSASARLGEKFRECGLYQSAKTIYGYLPYNQEVRTVPMLEQAIRDGKRVAVPKCYGQDMRFIYISDFENEVAPGYAQSVPRKAGVYKDVCHQCGSFCDAVYRRGGGSYVV